jgi:hypothetical protein
MLPLSDEDSAKLALAESAKKVSDLKAKQWEIAKSAVIILAFLAAVFHGDLKYASLPIPNYVKLAILGFYFGYFCLIFWQSSSNVERYKGIYRMAAQQLYSEAAKAMYFPDDSKKKDSPKGSEKMIEDEGRLQWFLFLVVAAFFVLVLIQIYAPLKKETEACPCGHTSLHILPHVGPAAAEMRPEWS